MTACAAKFSSSAISFSANGRHLLAVGADQAEEDAILAQRHRQHRAAARLDRNAGSRIGRATSHLHVGDMGEALPAQQSFVGAAGCGTEGAAMHRLVRLRHPTRRNRAEMLAVINYQGTTGYPAKGVRLLQDRVEDRHEVAGRRVDYP